MRAKILIKGQIGGNFSILRKLTCYEYRKDTMFNSFTVYYDSVTAAKNDLRRAIKSLKSEATEFNLRDRINKDATNLSWDASEAILYKIYKNEM
jgi:hypothetical protein